MKRHHPQRCRRHSWNLPTAPTVDALMLKVAGTRRRIHVRPHPVNAPSPSYWVESRYCHRRRAWYAILWPWPEPVSWVEWFHDDVRARRRPYRQYPGRTLPIYCDTREEAVGWAWTLADSEPAPCPTYHRRPLPPANLPAPAVARPQRAAGRAGVQGEGEGDGDTNE